MSVAESPSSGMGGLGQQNCAICTEYLKDSMPGPQNISRGSYHVPDALNDKAPEYKRTLQQPLEIAYAISLFII